MKYVDFELEIGPGGSLVARSEEGERRGEFLFPFDERSLKEQLLELENAVLRSASTLRRASSERDVVKEFGQKLFDASFPSGIRGFYERTVRIAEERGCGIRTKLRITQAKWSALPWEFLYNPDRAEYLCVQSHRPLVRYIEIDHPVKPLTVQLPLRILGLATSPAGYPTLEIEKEKNRVEKALENYCKKGLVELVWLKQGTWRELRRELQNQSWHVLHFIGHGGFDAEREEGLILLHGDDGSAHVLRADDLGNLLGGALLRFVLLNCCEGARADRGDIFSSTATTLVRRGIPAVLAMQYEISDKAAIEFARSFYESLVDGNPVDAAVADARLAIKIELRNSIEWATPVLFTHSKDGTLFTPPPMIVKPPTLDPSAGGSDPVQVVDGSNVMRPENPLGTEVSIVQPGELHPGDAVGATISSTTQPTEVRTLEAQAETVAHPPEPVAKPRAQARPKSPAGLPSVEWHGPDVPVRLIIAISDFETKERVRSMRQSLTREQPVFESKQSFRFVWDEIEPNLLEQALREYLAEHTKEQLVVVVSDVLTESAPSQPQRAVASGMTRAIREFFLDAPKLCGLVAVFNGERQRTNETSNVW